MWIPTICQAHHESYVLDVRSEEPNMDRGNYPDPEIWPDDDPDAYPVSKDELAREVLDGQEYAEWKKSQQRGRW